MPRSPTTVDGQGPPSPIGCLFEQTLRGMFSLLLRSACTLVQALFRSGPGVQSCLCSPNITLISQTGSLPNVHRIRAVANASSRVDRFVSSNQLSIDLHDLYWRTHAERDALDVKVEAIVLARDTGAMKRLETRAETAQGRDGLRSSLRPIQRQGRCPAGGAAPALRAASAGNRKARRDAMGSAGQYRFQANAGRSAVRATSLS